MNANVKPTLHEIAAMPYPASERAMRQHYDNNWHRGGGEGGELRWFKASVSYRYSVSERWSCEIQATSQEEAEKIVEDRFDDECHDADAEDCEIDDIDIDEIGEPE